MVLTQASRTMYLFLEPIAVFVTSAITWHSKWHSKWEMRVSTSVPRRGGGGRGGIINLGDGLLEALLNVLLVHDEIVVQHARTVREHVNLQPVLVLCGDCRLY